MYRALVLGLAAGAFLLSAAVFISQTPITDVEASSYPRNHIIDPAVSGDPCAQIFDIAASTFARSGRAIAGVDLDCGSRSIRTSFNLVNYDAITLRQAGIKNAPCIIRFPFNLNAHSIVTTPYDGVYLNRVLVQADGEMGALSIWFGENGTRRVNVIVY